MTVPSYGKTGTFTFINGKWNFSDRFSVRILDKRKHISDCSRPFNPEVNNYGVLKCGSNFWLCGRNPLYCDH